MNDRMQNANGGRTMTAPSDDRPVDGSSHAVHTDDIAQRFNDADDDRTGDDRAEQNRARQERAPGAGMPGGPADATAHGADRPANGVGTSAPQGLTPLVADESGYRKRWETVQTGFVDEPRRAVEQADTLVAEVIKELVGSFAEERGRLEAQWSKGDQASTEDLRVALQRYRSFFDRLLVA